MLTSCGGPGCVQADWVSKYSRIPEEENCELENGLKVYFVDSTTIKVGITEDQFTIEDMDIIFDECRAKIDVFNVSLDDDKFTITSGICVAVYVKS
ncbi:MAG: hypothetical protein ACI86M_001949 [Saprospiraceae bacterium]|jgi:hypothetical protein